MPDQALPLQFRQRGERGLDRSFGGSMDAPNPEIDNLDRVQAEIAQVVVHRGDEIGRGERRVPGGVVAAHRTHLGDDHQIGRVGAERLADDLVGDVRPVEVTGVDVVDPVRRRFAQHGERGLAILRRTEHARPGQLHRPVAEAVHGAVAEAEGAGGGDVGHGRSPKLRPLYGNALAPPRVFADVVRNGPTPRLYGVPASSR